ncbi:unnamed protein product [Boreogadus saida]
MDICRGELDSWEQGTKFRVAPQGQVIMLAWVELFFARDEAPGDPMGARTKGTLSCWTHVRTFVFPSLEKEVTSGIVCSMEGHDQDSIACLKFHTEPYFRSQSNTVYVMSK